MPSRSEQLSADGIISTSILVSAAGCSRLRAQESCSSLAPSCSIQYAPRLQRLRALLLALRCGAACLVVVVDPGACRAVAVQSHGFHGAEIDPGPGDLTGARDTRADIERTIRIAEGHRASAPGRRRGAERPPLLRAGAPD